MTHAIHVWPEEWSRTDESVILSAVIELPGGQQRLWYRLPIESERSITTQADPFAIATVFFSMQSGEPLHIHGTVSPSLLANLEEFQAVWNCWKPDRYRRTDMTADEEREAPAASSGDAIACFSGGVDASFTIYRHTRGLCGRRNRQIGAAILMDPWGVDSGDNEQFVSAFCDAARVLQDVDIPLVKTVTNWRRIQRHAKLLWNDVFNTCFAASMQFLQPDFRIGILASGDKYYFVRPHGSTPMTDRLLSSDAFAIVTDGAEYSRVDKIEAISHWDETLRYLQVCWEGPDRDKNCGSCEKCIRTILNFRVLGKGVPPCFSRDVTDGEIAAVPIRNSTQRNEFASVVREARERGLGGESWLGVLERRLQEYDKRTDTAPTRGQRIPQVFRGPLRRLRSFATATRS